LIALLSEDRGFAAVRDAAEGYTELAIDAPAGVRPALATAVAEARQTVVVTATGREAEEFAAAATAYLPADRIAILPSWETLPHERLSPRADTLSRRIAVFRRLAHPDDAGPHGPIDLLIVPVRAFIQPVVAGLGNLDPITAQSGSTIDLDALAQQLIEYAYIRTDMVERRGEFAMRGGILDIFPPTETHPLRIDLWGDEVDEIRYFAVADQRSGEIATGGLWAAPCREILLTQAVRQRAADLAPCLPAAREILAKLAEGIAVEGMESLTPALVDAMVPVTDLLDSRALVIFTDPERLRRRAADLEATTAEFLSAAWSTSAHGGAAPVDLDRASYLTLDEARAQGEARGLVCWTVASFGLPSATAPDDDAPAPNLLRTLAGGDAGEPGDGIVRVAVGMRPGERFAGDVQAALRVMRDQAREGWRVLLLAEGHGPAQRLVEQLGAEQVAARLVDSLAADVPGGMVLVTVAPGQGFVAPDLRLAVVTQADLTGRAGASTREMRAMPRRRVRNAVDPLALKAGDLVVHEAHGIGRFVELVSRTVGTGDARATREYVVVEYAPSRRGHPGDRLFVPTDALDQLTKYVGGESPNLSKMGGSDWAKAKSQAKRAVREIAGELIRLYSARMSSPGFAFSPDTPWQGELEDAFAYIETPDQLQTIDEVKADMEAPVPMDRLICGDVGYGKTEIAVRAAFKAVQDSKQTAVLVPTTLLVQQHMETFTERYAPFPITVRPLSRFQTRSEAAATRAGVADGTVDVVIGTHALITGDIHFKDLGLVIVDEEQRFGVEHKETLKALRTDVDVLSMSATPIPRTLEMAVSGIREMSTLATPPEERHPVLTYVGVYDKRQIAAAIHRELLRDGQVFYVHNRVSSIGSVAATLRELVPEARVAIAHGRMREHELEKVIVDFWNKESDVLVCTTIIETGLDISNANTLIVDRAERMGLAQLHQLRGRVGRGRERAYAYFLYPPDPPLTETAHDRLTTIASQSELGAGMAVAMKDLEIRGAGNLLGGEQSGHIEGVGFDLYLRMIAEAVAEFRGSPDSEPAEVTIELPIDAHIPHSYIDADRLRLEAYTKLAAAVDAARLVGIREELIDRYGPTPPEVENLFHVARLRILARTAGLTDITAQGRFIRFHPVELPESRRLRLKRVHPGAVIKPATRTVLVPLPREARLGGSALRDADVVSWASRLIEDIVHPDPGGAEPK
jgi:transcription-repair coupling factor (superfamily II helicase)